MARCGCGGDRCSCLLVAGPGVTVVGNGSPTAPYVISAGGSSGISTANSPCITLTGDGTPGAPLTVVPRLDPAAGNQLTCGPNGLLVSGAGGGTVTTGCGLTGDGAAGSPVQVAVQPWPYPCPVDVEGGGIFCAPDGVLRGEPRTRIRTAAASAQETFPNIAVPSGSDVPVITRSLTIDNPDPCRDAELWLFVYNDVSFRLPANSSAGWGFGTDDMVRLENRGSSTADELLQLMKPFGGHTIPAGGTFTYSVDITMGGGSGGATYSRIQWAIVGLAISK